ncbi:type II secretion system protein GspM [Diaphorobacter aerolatus]|uniref:Type II secretion system protein M n=1 Tax=Diaphorobacter aerolatus TaxID=1288495 RepID=A0A7H0GNM5_9BURK|nr:type II secretion system protein GspM [Diaphorobacter aerolatus]QNP49891.1 type II secretion system protein M [Diaphorobacter aerolatus]
MKKQQAKGSSNRLAAVDVLRARWKTLAAREQTLVLIAASVVGLAVLWWLLLSPAIKTLRNAPAEHAQLDRQLQHMRSLQQEALELQKAPRVQGDDATRALQSSLTQAMGATAQVTFVGDRATVTLKAAPAAALGQWLAQVRGTARAIPIQAKLVRTNGAGKTGSNASTTLPAFWDGTLVLSMPVAN